MIKRDDFMRALTLLVVLPAATVVIIPSVAAAVAKEAKLTVSDDDPESHAGNDLALLPRPPPRWPSFSSAPTGEVSCSNAA
jgi:hypothetical protein